MGSRPQLRSVNWSKVTAILAPRDGTDPLAQLAGDLAAAHRAGRAVEAVIGRPNAATGQCVWLYGDLYETGSAPNGHRATIARGRVDDALDLLAAWVMTSGTIMSTETLSGPDMGSYGPADVLEAAAGEPVVWVVRAEPISADDVTAERQELSSEIARASAGGHAAQRSADRTATELDMLDDRSAYGLWRVQVWAGAKDGAHALGAMMAVGQMAGPPQAPLRLGPGGRGWVGHREVASLLRPPNVELPGLRIVERPAWDGVQELDANDRSGRFTIGTIVASDGSPTTSPVSVSASALNRHGFVTGATGSGKSETVRSLLVQLANAGVPWLVIEPAKAEYHELAGSLPGPLTVLRIGDRAYPAAGLNPLRPTSTTVNGQRRSFPLQTHIDLVQALFEAAFEAEEPFPQILASALERSYRSLGWELGTGARLRTGTSQIKQPLAYPTLDSVRRHALAVIDAAGYSREVRDNVRGFVDVRLGSLVRGTPGRFCTSSHELDLPSLLDSHVVLQIEDVGNQRDQAFVMGTVLVRWIELLRLRGPAPDLQHVIVIEEAHRLLRNPEGQGGSNHAVELLANLLAEVRAYGQGVIVAEQIPTKIIPDVVKNSALKVVHRLPSADDRAFVGATMNFDEAQSRATVAFSPGTAAVHVAGMDRPIQALITRTAPPRTRPAALAAPAVAVRTWQCRQQCGAAPCGLTEITAADRLFDQLELVQWIDLVVVAVLTGQLLPDCADHVAFENRRAVADLERRRCGWRRAVEQAINRRWQDVAPYCSIDEVQGAVVDLVEARLELGRWPSERADPMFQVRHCRWLDVEQALIDLDEAHAGPHPSTDAWQRERIDLAIPTARAADQLAHVQRAHAIEFRDAEELLYGSEGPLHDASFRRNPPAALARIGVTQEWAVRRFVPAGPEQPG
jgi:hypothetical protein